MNDKENSDEDEENLKDSGGLEASGLIRKGVLQQDRETSKKSSLASTPTPVVDLAERPLLWFSQLPPVQLSQAQSKFKNGMHIRSVEMREAVS